MIATLINAQPQKHVCEVSKKTISRRQHNRVQLADLKAKRWQVECPRHREGEILAEGNNGGNRDEIKIMNTA